MAWYAERLHPGSAGDTWNTPGVTGQAGVNMKGAQGIMIAVAMGVVGFVCNWLYLEREASRVELVSFVGVSQPADVKRGDVIQSGDLVPISMPKSHESQLAQVAVLWDQRDLVIGQKAARDLAVSGEAELVMHRDPVSYTHLRAHET